MAETPRFDHHGTDALRGQAGVTRSSTSTGRFGRLFRALTPHSATDDELAALARSMRDPEDGTGSHDNPAIPAGYTYFGQFVSHDITFDPVSSLDRLNDPDALESFRTPRYDLDSLYGLGRSQSPYLYDEDDRHKLLVGTNQAAEQDPVDLPRNEQGRALIGDPRNDVHVIIGQLHLAFILFHNAVVDHLRSRFVPDPELTTEARRLVTWHYQWIVLHDFLRRLVGPDLLGEILPPTPAGAVFQADLRHYRWRSRPWLPVEFSAAAFRFGHSAARATYRLNGELEPFPVFAETDTANAFLHLGGFRRLPRDWTLDWSMFVEIDGSTPQPSRAVDTRLADPLHRLPGAIDGQHRSLALLNLLRGRALQLPSGQAVARAMGTSIADPDLGLAGDAPLWYYLLREAEVVAGGTHLGPTGGRIVAEVLLGLLVGDPSSFARQAPGWTPELPSAVPGQFTLADLLRFAGVA